MRLFHRRLQSALPPAKSPVKTGRKNTFFLIVVFFCVSPSAGLRRAALRQQYKQQGSIHSHEAFGPGPEDRAP
jgi:hypothetical protein